MVSKSLCPMDCSSPDFPVLYCLPEFAQTHARWVNDASNHLILCCLLHLPSSIFPSIRVFSNESALRLRWPKCWSFSFSTSPSNMYIHVNVSPSLSAKCTESVSDVLVMTPYFKKRLTDWLTEVAQSCPTLCDPMDCSLSGSSVYGIFQARVLEWIAISFSRGCSWPRNRTRVSHIAGRHFTVWATREATQKKSLATKKDTNPKVRTTLISTFFFFFTILIYFIKTDAALDSPN